MEEWIDDNLLTIVGIVVAIIAFIIPIYKYLFDRKLQSQDARFKIYHGLIRNLVEPDFQDDPTSNNIPNIQHIEKGKKVGKLDSHEIMDVLEGLDIDVDTIEGLLSVDKASWLEDVENIKAFYAQVGEAVPATMYEELAALEARLG